MGGDLHEILVPYFLQVVMMLNQVTKSYTQIGVASWIVPPCATSYTGVHLPQLDQTSCLQMCPSFLGCQRIKSKGSSAYGKDMNVAGRRELNSFLYHQSDLLKINQKSRKIKS